MVTENNNENNENNENEGLENTGAADDAGTENADNTGSENETPDAGAENTGSDGAADDAGQAAAADGEDQGSTAKNDKNDDKTSAPELSGFQQKLQELNSRHTSLPLEEPARPAKDRDEAPEEWEQYRADMAVFKAQKSQHAAQTKQNFNEITQQIRMQRQEFEKGHTPEESEAFFGWLNSDPDMQNSIARGARNMQNVYDKIYLAEARGAQSQRRIAEVREQGGKHKAAQVNKRGTGAGGRFAGLKYAGRPEYRDLAENLAKEVKDLKRVDELIKRQMERDVMRVV